MRRAAFVMSNWVRVDPDLVLAWAEDRPGPPRRRPPADDIKSATNSTNRATLLARARVGSAGRSLHPTIAARQT